MRHKSGRWGKDLVKFFFRLWGIERERIAMSYGPTLFCFPFTYTIHFENSLSRLYLILEMIVNHDLYLRIDLYDIGMKISIVKKEE